MLLEAEAPEISFRSTAGWAKLGEGPSCLEFKGSVFISANGHGGYGSQLYPWCLEWCLGPGESHSILAKEMKNASSFF